ncbi:MAG: hypothetical protein JOY57_00765, partial [Actinobacteria bacterium]|nr:hypothetical protein [Actinomycetota bacterium]
MKPHADETVSLVLLVGVSVALVAHAIAGLTMSAPNIGGSSLRVRLLTQGAQPVTGLLVLLAVLVILLTP